MSNIFTKLPQPFFVLAPMDDVTDTVFRQVVAKCAPPDLYFTEFVSVDGLQSPGRTSLMDKLKFTDAERPLIAQIWGLKPENYEQTARDLVAMGFAGIDINLGCPVPKVVKMGACSALINNRELATELIAATKRGAGELPVSIKTRIGIKELDLSWIEFLLKQDLAALTVHTRTVKAMSKVPADWAVFEEIVKLRDQLAPKTVLIGNGDVLSRQQGLELAQRYGLEGIMIGRGVFHDPFVFAADSPWADMDRRARLDLFADHIKLFMSTWGETHNPASLKKFAKIYVNGFAGASELRVKLMAARSAAELLALVLE